jgi:anti-sigma factor ChrR (cupin superfamily)
MGHEEVSELLGAFALDAVEPDEAVRIESHLEACPRCRDELRNHREVVGLLSYSGAEAPPGLWDRVVEGVRRHESKSSIPISGGHPVVIAQSDPDALSGRVARRSIGGGRAVRTVSLIAAAAVVLVALLGVQVARLQHRIDHVSGQVVAMSHQPTMAVVEAALAEPGTRRVTLSSFAGGPASLDAVILPNGSGYLYHSDLAPLAPTLTYQLWGVTGTERVSYGLIGSSPAPVTAFRVGSPVQALAVTVEVAGGVVTTSHAPVAAGVID